MSLRLRVRGIVGLALLVASSLAGSVTAKEDPQALPRDESIVVRTLTNGMRVCFCPNANPKGAVSIALYMDVGSVQEQDDQRGYAHFVEHMAFDGSMHFPPGTVRPYFDYIGASGGRLNGRTSYDWTVYLAHLPSYDAESLRRTLLFFADVGRSLRFDSQEVEKEKPVIVAEARDRPDPAGNEDAAVRSLALRDSRYLHRAPIGDLDVVRSATSESLRAFYRAWYRPERAVLVVVGDVGWTTLEPIVERLFANWKASGPRPPAIDRGVTVPGTQDVRVQTDPETLLSSIRIVHRRPAAVLTDRHRVRDSMLHYLAANMLERRLKSRKGNGVAFRTLFGSVDWFRCRSFATSAWGATAEPEAWKTALRALVMEIRRARTEGFTPAELAEVRTSWQVEGTEVETSQRTSALAENLLSQLDIGMAPTRVKPWRNVRNEILAGVAAADVNASLRSTWDWSRIGLVITLPRPEKGATAPTVPDVRAELEACLRGPIDAPSPSTAEPRSVAPVVKLVDEEPQAGRFVARRHYPELDVRTARTGNGVHVQWKPVDGKSVHVTATFFGGILEEKKEVRGITDVLCRALAQGRITIGKHDEKAVARYLQAHDLTWSTRRDTAHFALTIGAPSDKLEAALRLLHAAVRELKIESGALEDAKEATAYEAWKDYEDPWARAESNLEWYLSGSDVRFRPIRQETCEALTGPQTQTWLDRLLRTAPMEVAIVGGFQTDDVEVLAQRWLGSLPQRPDRFDALRALQKLSQWKLPQAFRDTGRAKGTRAAVTVAWRGADDLRGHLRLTAVAFILKGRLYDTVRERDGLTYSISVSYELHDYEGMRRIRVDLTTDPDKAARAATRVREVVAQFAADGPTEAEVVAAQRMISSQVALVRASSEPWSMLLPRRRALRIPLEGLHALLERPKITQEGLAATARQTLRPDRRVQIIVDPNEPNNAEAK